MNQTHVWVITNLVTLTCQEVRIRSYLSLTTSLNMNSPRRDQEGIGMLGGSGGRSGWDQIAIDAKTDKSYMRPFFMWVTTQGETLA